MKIGIDATPLSVSTGGIARYTCELHRALTHAFPKDCFEAMEPQGGRWWSAGLPRALRDGRFDVFHGTDFAVPYLPVAAAVMTIHDLSPWRSEWREETSSRVRRRTPWLLRLGLATMVITPTEAIRAEALDRFKLAPDRVVAVPHGVDPLFRPVLAPPPAQPYLLFVGTHGARKNAATAIAAAQAAGIELWIAGRGDWRAEPGVRILGAVEDARLPALYSGARALLFPSHYEGFGMPLAEALACGCPVIASNDHALREVSGGAAVHCDAHDLPAWVAAIHAVRPPLAPASPYTWERTARLTREVYREAYCRRGR